MAREAEIICGVNGVVPRTGALGLSVIRNLRNRRLAN
jgi:hypothetical protein